MSAEIKLRMLEGSEFQTVGAKAARSEGYMPKLFADSHPTKYSSNHMIEIRPGVSLTTF